MKDEAKNKKQLKAELSKAQERISELEDACRTLRALIDAAPVSIAKLDCGGTVKIWNRASENLFGWKEEAALGGSLPAVAENKAQEFLALTESALRGQAVNDIDTRFVRKDGSPVDISLSMSPLRDGAGDVIGVVLIMADITERKRAEEKQTELQQSLRRSEMMSALGAMIAAVAHDVRNPLFSMTVVLDAFEEDFRDREEYKEYTSILRSDMERLSVLMRELLQYGKPQNENISAGYIEPVIDQAMQASTHLAKRLKVNIEKRIAEKLPPIAMDRTRVFQVFQNLLDNALRHSPSGEAVVIEAEEIRQDERVWIECRVKDSGPGFRPEDLSKIYDPFFTRRGGGTGLGLSIVQRIAEQHGGNVAAANRPEGGAVVAVRFPAAVE